jgi:2-pyrone-4,6-dicarboxylate lactonase
MNAEEICLPPLAQVSPASFSVPERACDSHAHVISTDSVAYPMVAHRAFTPPSASEDAYLAMLAATGMQRGVLVQISVYGTDNRYLLDVLRRHPDRLRGVVVVDPTTSDQALLEMHELGVLVSGGVGFDALETLAARVAPLGWHIQLFMNVQELPELLPRMKRLPCPCVVDHIGHMPVGSTVTEPGFQALLRMASDHGWWVKLSGAFRISNDHGQYRDVTPLVHELIRVAPDRLVWGSDWPHVGLTAHMPDNGVLRNLLPIWVPDPDLRQRILVVNPAELYSFSS